MLIVEVHIDKYEDPSDSRITINLVGRFCPFITLHLFSTFYYSPPFLVPGILASTGVDDRTMTLEGACLSTPVFGVDDPR